MGGISVEKKCNPELLKPWGRNWEPRCKVIAAVIFVFGVVGLHNPWVVLFAFLFVVGSSVLMGLKVFYLFSRLALLLPFLALMTVPLILGGGFPPSGERVVFASLISLKALTSMTVMIVMLSSQPLEELLEGLSNMKIPPLFIAVLFLACRYALLFREEMKNIRRALASRLFAGGLRMPALKVYGEICAGLFVKSFDRSDSVYRAMTSRGFDGQLPAGSTPQVSRSDLLKSAAAVSFILVLIALERVVLL